MQSKFPEAIQNLEKRIGEEVVVTDWMEISQAETDAFAKLTNDEDPMHNDPAWATKTHWGGTIVQAAHVLSLGAGTVATNDKSLDTRSDGNSYVLNYGYDRVRVIAPLRVGHPFRYRARIVAIRTKSENEYVLKHEVTVEVKGREAPFLVYEGLTFWATNQNMAKVEKKDEA